MRRKKEEGQVSAINQHFLFFIEITGGGIEPKVKKQALVKSQSKKVKKNKK